MAVIQVRTIDTETGAEVRGSLLRTGSPRAAIDHALLLNEQYSAPRYAVSLLYSGDFVDPAFAELSQFAQQHGLDLDIGAA